MATTTTTQTKAVSSLPHKAALGLLSSLPTTNPTLRTIQRTLPLLPPSILPNLPNLGNGQSSAMAATLAAVAGTQNPNPSNATNANNTNNTNQNNMCEVRSVATSALRVLFLTPFVRQNCHLHPRWFDPASGVLHNFCSRACAKANAGAANCEVIVLPP
jgi:hypothetical protein